MPLTIAAQAARRTLFATWHSRFAPAVEPARQLLLGRRITSVRITWKEDVRVWHPGQAWILEPGGLGVFDPGINALSILTRILPQPLFVTSADLAFPANRDAPIAASLALGDAQGLQITAEFDFRQTGPQSWDIDLDTDGGPVTLSLGGARFDGGGQAARRCRGGGISPGSIAALSSSPQPARATSTSRRSKSSPMRSCWGGAARSSHSRTTT